MASKKKKAKQEFFHIRATKEAKQKLAKEAKVTKKTVTQIFEDMIEDRYTDYDPIREMQQEFRRASERMQVVLADQIERTTKLAHAIVIIQQYAESHGTNHKDFAQFIINACKDSLRCQ